MTCIFCKSEEGPFISREHIAPESLGNDKFILPPGVVCDPCNNGVLARLDNHLLTHEYIKFVRTWFKVPNKIGSVPEARLGNMNMRPTDTGMYVELPNYKRKHFEQLPSDKPGEVRFKLIMRGKKQTVAESRKIARALYKIGLEFLAHDLGVNEVLDKKYDEVRDIVLGKYKGFSGYIIVKGDAPHAGGKFTHQEFVVPDAGGVRYFTFNLYGMILIFDMTRRKIENEDMLKKAGASVLTW